MTVMFHNDADEAAVERSLSDAGLKVTGRLSALRGLVGTVAPDQLDVLKQVPGASVEQSQGFQISPPDSEIQ